MAMYLTKATYHLLDSLKETPVELASLFIQSVKDNADKRYRYKKRLEQLALKDIVYLSGEVVSLTEKGKKMLEDYDFGKVEIPSYRWDGVWQIVAWDIPTALKVNANILRRILKDIGFTMINKSFWAYPYRCQEEIGIVAKRLKISNYVIYLQTNNLPRADRLYKKYHLSGN